MKQFSKELDALYSRKAIHGLGGRTVPPHTEKHSSWGILGKIEFHRVKRGNANGNTNMKNRLFNPLGEGEGGMIWDSNIETCTLPYVQ